MEKFRGHRFCNRAIGTDDQCGHLAYLMVVEPQRESHHTSPESHSTSYVAVARRD